MTNPTAQLLDPTTAAALDDAIGPPAAPIVDLYGAAADFVCPGCRAVFPQHCSPTCPRQPDALGVLLAAVHDGATLVINGKPEGDRFRVAIWKDDPSRTHRQNYDDPNRRVVTAGREALGAAIVAAAVLWKLPPGEKHDHRCSRLRGAATCDCGPSGQPMKICSSSANRARDPQPCVPDMERPELCLWCGEPIAKGNAQ